jgi:GTP cyclohydrolase I
MRLSDLPDVSHDLLSALQVPLDRVGMENIEMPVRLRSGSAEPLQVPAKVDAFVNLGDTTAKGIHMSRLFLRLQETLEREELSPAVLSALLKAFAAEQEGLSQQSFLRVRLDWPMKRPALVSQLEGWRSYPVLIQGTWSGSAAAISVGASVAYSSTCPCSAALARQLVQRKFREDFAGRRNPDAEAVVEWLGLETSMAGLPHAQRSHAEFRVRIQSDRIGFGLRELIDDVESTLGTPVQAAVKRVDEQEFAKRNAQNLMFCEDAARRLKLLFDTKPFVEDFFVRVSHAESLHPHDAVAKVVKGIPGGWQADN